MYFRKIKRKCRVRGCRCTESYAISLASEVGNTVIICKSCLEKALKAIEEGKPEPEKKKPSGIPSLFFNGVLKAEPAEAEPIEVTEPLIDDMDDVSGLIEDDGIFEPSDAEPIEVTEPSEFVCPHCGQVCKTALGLQKHIDAKHKDVK